jgi:hypothetical protein
MNKNQTIYARIPEELYDALKAEAEDMGVSISAIVRWAINARYHQQPAKSSTIAITPAPDLTTPQPQSQE